jgi:hypothetical protein
MILAIVQRIVPLMGIVTMENVDVMMVIMELTALILLVLDLFAITMKIINKRYAIIAVSQDLSIPITIHLSKIFRNIHALMTTFITRMVYVMVLVNVSADLAL